MRRTLFKKQPEKALAIQSDIHVFPTGVPIFGYVSTRSILSDRVIVQFSVPDHAWNELQESREWRDFQSLLEEVQKEHIQKGR